MMQIVAVLPHKAADRLGTQWKAGRCNAYTRTMVRVCASGEAAQLVALTLPRGSIWGFERAGA